MATKIYWFSGTGNTLHAARRIAKAMEGVELISIAAVMGGDVEPEPAGTVGLAFPVYAWGLPELVARFIEQKLPAESVAYCFGLMTYAADPGSATKHLRKLLVGRNVELDASFGIRMPENYPPMGGAPPLSDQDRILAKAEADLDELARTIAQRPRGQFLKGKWYWRLLGTVIWGFFRRHVRKSDKHFSADNTCTRCGLCEKVCPVGDIKLVDGRPVWQSKCQQCYACFHFCPVEAIQYKHKTAKQHRYHHPEVTVEPLMQRSAWPG